MANNCQLVRRARRKWYRRLTDKCNMHDRHSGVGVEVPAVYVEVQEENRAQPAADLNADVSCAEVRVTFGMLNMQVKNLDEGFQDILCKCDILCLQEVTPSCVEDLLQINRTIFFTTYGVSLATAMDCRVSLLDAWEAIEAETATINVPGQFFKAMPHFPIGFSI